MKLLITAGHKWWVVMPMFMLPKSHYDWKVSAKRF